MNSDLAEDAVCGEDAGCGGLIRPGVVGEEVEAGEGVPGRVAGTVRHVLVAHSGRADIIFDDGSCLPILSQASVTGGDRGLNGRVTRFLNEFGRLVVLNERLGVDVSFLAFGFLKIWCWDSVSWHSLVLLVLFSW